MQEAAADQADDEDLPPSGSSKSLSSEYKVRRRNMFPEVNNLVTPGGRRAVLPYGTRFCASSRVTSWRPRGGSANGAMGRESKWTALTALRGCA
jgi:hypothetical protein